MSEEDLDYDVPVHCISHHEVLKQDLTSTPCRIVLKTSASYKITFQTSIGLKKPIYWAIC